MKLLLACLLFVVFNSCMEPKPKIDYLILYEFENLNELSANDKQGTIEALRKRLERFATNFTIELNNKQQLEVKLSTEYELKRVNLMFENPGKLEFWDCIRMEKTGDFLYLMSWFLVHIVVFSCFGEQFKS